MAIVNGDPELVCFADIESLVGRRFVGATFSFIRQEQELFQHATWLAKTYRGPDPPEMPAGIVEGFYALAMLDSLRALVFRIDPTEAYSYNYGLNRVRFTSPIVLGDVVRPVFDVSSVKQRKSGFLLNVYCRIEKMAPSPQTALVASWLSLVLPRSATGDD